LNGLYDLFAQIKKMEICLWFFNKLDQQVNFEWFWWWHIILRISELLDFIHHPAF
jgi:hypothetical protein